MTTEFERRRRQRKRNRARRALNHRLEVALAITIAASALFGLLAFGFIGHQEMQLEQQELAFWATQGIEIARW